MGAYNWIIINEKCPVCGSTAGIKCQTHMASDYDGDDSGRFFDRSYHLGEEMAWWQKGERKYKDWRKYGAFKEESGSVEIAEECCYSNCSSCGAELFVVLRFVDRVPVEIKEVGTGWPLEYPK